MISLVQTSQNRHKELYRFLLSLNAQKGIDFKEIQLIFVDQGNNRAVFTDINQEIDFVYIKSKPCSLSRARNIGLKYVKGEYIGFPDDDCWYEPNTIWKALSILEEGCYQGVTGKGTNEYGVLTSRFPKETQNVKPIKRCAAISYTMFYRYQPEVKFDENLGVGSPFNLGSGEETDYMLNLMEYFGYKILYFSELIIHHPTSDDYPNTISLLTKSYSYARGGGYLMKKHKFPIQYVLLQFIRPLVGILIHAIQANKFATKKSFYLLKGRIEGYFYKNVDK